MTRDEARFFWAKLLKDRRMTAASLAGAMGEGEDKLSRRLSGECGHPDEVGVLLCAVMACSSMMSREGVMIDDDYTPTLARLLAMGRREFERRKAKARAESEKSRIARL